MRIFLSSPHMGGSEMNFINKAFETNWVAPIGPQIDEFEHSIANYVGSKHAVALSSGTAAIHLALLYLGVGRGDVVFCSTLTFAATCNPIVYLGATPIFIDSEESSWNMCPKALKKALAKFPNPKAIITVNLYGQPADFDSIKSVAEKIPIVEDAAESLGAEYKGQQTGTFGDIGIFSFNGNKIITTSGGGMLVTNNEEIAKKVRFWSTQAREPFPWYQHSEIGYNYRLSNICASIGCGQMKVLPDRIAKKRSIKQFYEQNLRDMFIFMPETEFSKSTFWLTAGLLTNKDILPVDVVNALERNNIEARPVWKPMHLQPVYNSAPYFTAEDKIDVAAGLFAKGVCLPSDTKMTKEDQERVINVCKSI